MTILMVGSTSVHKLDAARRACGRLHNAVVHQTVRLRDFNYVSECVEARKRAMEDVIEVRGVSVPSVVPEQPIGLQQIADGARHRAQKALGFDEGRVADYGLGIENGIVDLGPLSGGFIDIAVVALCRPRDDARAVLTDATWVYTTSTGIQIEDKYVHRSMDEQQQHSAASFIALETGGDPTDPFKHITRGQLSRSDLLEQAVYAALVMMILPQVPKES
jgi:non-canonical (house-cleaning) NTP pyrophosphatase